MNILILEKLEPHLLQIGIIIVVLFLVWVLYKMMTISAPLTFFIVSTIVLVYALYHYYLKDIISETDVFEPAVSLIFQQEETILNT